MYLGPGELIQPLDDVITLDESVHSINVEHQFSESLENVLLVGLVAVLPDLPHQTLHSTHRHTVLYSGHAYLDQSVQSLVEHKLQDQVCVILKVKTSDV